MPHNAAFYHCLNCLLRLKRSSAKETQFYFEIIWYLQWPSHAFCMGLDARKPVLGGLQITQVQTSPRIRSVWSKPLLFTFWKLSSVNLPQVKFQFSSYSPAAIIRNAKIWNIILLLAYFRTLSSNLDLEYPAVSEENCLKNLLLLPWPLISWEFRHF